MSDIIWNFFALIGISVTTIGAMVVLGFMAIMLWANEVDKKIEDDYKDYM